MLNLTTITRIHTVLKLSLKREKKPIYLVCNILNILIIHRGALLQTQKNKSPDGSHPISAQN